MPAFVTIAGILFIGMESISIVDPSPTPAWSFADDYECPCLEWSTALPLGRSCLDSAMLWPLACGEPMYIVAYSQAPDRLTPARDTLAIVGPFNPADADMDGMLTLKDFGTPIDWDWNQDGGVSAQDQVDFVSRFAAAIVLPRNLGGCP